MRLYVVIVIIYNAQTVMPIQNPHASKCDDVQISINR